MANLLVADNSNVQTGLNTWTFNVVTAGPYVISCNSAIDPGSALSIVLNHNGSSIATSIAPAPAQISVYVEAHAYCNQGDTLTAVLSSSNQEDGVPNAVKSIIKVGKVP